MANQYVNKVALSDGKVLIDLSSDTIDAEHLLTGTTAHDKSGATITGTCTYDSDTSTDTVAASEILTGKTAHARGAKITGTMPNRGSTNGTIATVDGKFTIPQGYHDGTGKVQIDADEQAKIVAKNIREGVTILGVTGEMNGLEEEQKQTKTVTPKLTAQTVLPDENYTCLTQVTVEAIPVAYSDNSAGGQTVTIG